MNINLPNQNVDMPYEKFIKKGANSLTDAELLAIIIRTGAVGESAVTISKKVLQLGGTEESLLNLFHISMDDLQKIRGIGVIKAIKIQCICELAIRISSQSAKENISFHSPASIANYYMETMRHKEVENVLLVLLDNKNSVLKELILSKGTINASLVSTREIFLQALRYRASCFILLHNHPSGDPNPSAMDLCLTQKINKAAEIMNITLLDHIIIGNKKYVSLKEKGYIEGSK